MYMCMLIGVDTEQVVCNYCGLDAGDSAVFWLCKGFVFLVFLVCLFFWLLVVVYIYIFVCIYLFVCFFKHLIFL